MFIAQNSATQSGTRKLKNAGRKGNLFFIVWSCDEKESLIKLRESRRDISVLTLLFVAALGAARPGAQGYSKSILWLDLIRPEKLPGRYSIDSN